MYHFELGMITSNELPFNVIFFNDYDHAISKKYPPVTYHISKDLERLNGTETDSCKIDQVLRSN